jgi:hypothetical protein
MFNSAALGDPLRPTQTTFATSKRQKPRHSRAWKQRQQENQEPDSAVEAPEFFSLGGTAGSFGASIKVRKKQNKQQPAIPTNSF